MEYSHVYVLNICSEYLYILSVPYKMCLMEPHLKERISPWKKKFFWHIHLNSWM